MPEENPDIFIVFLLRNRIHKWNKI